MDEIDKLLNDEKDNSEPNVETPEATKPTEEEVRKAQLAKEVADLEAAKAAALEQLKTIRADKRQAKKTAPTESEDQEPVIDMTDPNAKAWDKHIRETVTPVQEELEKQKAEVREFALQEFLASRPALAKNPAKLKELMDVYERLHTASERTSEGVLLDLDRAYAAVYHRELLEAAQERKLDRARKDALFSDVAVSRGATAYATPKERPVQLSGEEQAILAKWNMTPQEWQKLRDEQRSREQESV